MFFPHLVWDDSNFIAVAIDNFFPYLVPRIGALVRWLIRVFDLEMDNVKASELLKRRGIAELVINYDQDPVMLGSDCTGKDLYDSLIKSESNTQFLYKTTYDNYHPDDEEGFYLESNIHCYPDEELISKHLKEWGDSLN